MTTNDNAHSMSGEEFVARLAEENRAALDRLGELSAVGDVPDSISIEQLLRIALKNELEASEIAAIWMVSTTEIDVKLALARQCGDEARHYHLILERLKALGVDVAQIDPLKGGYSPLFEYLRSLQNTAARVAAGQFTREGIALVRNQVFVSFCEARGDTETAALYWDQIQPDELHHHELGKRLLTRYAVTPADQRAARQAARYTTELAEEIQEMARLKAGITRAPGC
jgi:1,2-phenylacetyl-CoA epoxidase catalytic subunit